jgi:hypothetical protein
MIARLAAVMIAATIAAAPAAIASNATPAQVASLASRALSDPNALETLRTVDHVDGRPVALAAALNTNGAALAARLRVLAATSHLQATSTTLERRFMGSAVPRPLHGPLRWLGRRLHSLYNALTGWLPGGSRIFWLLIAAAVAAIVAVSAVRLGRRRAGRLVERGVRPARDTIEDPRKLERDADEAERRGDLERALRLRFRAGLIRLMRSEAIPGRESLTNGEIARQLDSRSFRQLAADFDEVVYGRRAAGGDDLTRARDAWPLVLDEAGRP